MIARYAPEPPAQSVWRGNPLKPPGAASETSRDRTVVALGMLSVPLIAFGAMLGVFLVMAAG